MNAVKKNRDSPTPLPVLEVYQRWGPKLAIECHCGGGHYIVFSAEAFDDGDELFWEVYILEEWRSTRSLWGRLRAAWRLFWTGSSHVADVGLNRHDVARVRRWATDVLARSLPRPLLQGKWQAEERERFGDD